MLPPQILPNLLEQTATIFHIKQAFHLGHAPLGRFLRRRMNDPRRAESVFILCATALGLLVMLFNQIAWLFVRDAVLADPGGPVAIQFWLGQLGLIGLLLFTSVIGFKPAITISLNTEELKIYSKTETITIAAEDVTDIKPITALMYHRHYRRYRQTRCFVNQIPPELLLLETTDGPVVLGLAEETHAQIIATLIETPVPDFEAMRMAV